VEPARDPAGVRVISTEFLLPTGRPLGWREPAAEQFVWRGALEAGVLREFLSDVIWGELELLLVDLPPGADGVADVKALVPELAGAIAVTIPTDESERSVARALAAARDAGIDLLGVIENMSGARSPEGAALGPLFPGDAGAALAASFDIPLLARVPFAMPAPGAGAVPSLDPGARARVLEALR
jgi:ATP-binding protein involved in chromosome partitioning